MNANAPVAKEPTPEETTVEFFQKLGTLQWEPLGDRDRDCFAGVESDTALICYDEDGKTTYILDSFVLSVLHSDEETEEYFDLSGTFNS